VEAGPGGEEGGGKGGGGVGEGGGGGGGGRGGGGGGYGEEWKPTITARKHRRTGKTPGGKGKEGKRTTGGSRRQKSRKG